MTDIVESPTEVAGGTSRILSATPRTPTVSMTPVPGSPPPLPLPLFPPPPPPPPPPPSSSSVSSSMKGSVQEVVAEAISDSDSDNEQDHQTHQTQEKSSEKPLSEIQEKDDKTTTTTTTVSSLHEQLISTPPSSSSSLRAPVTAPPKPVEWVAPKLFMDLEFYPFFVYASIYFQKEKSKIFRSFSLDSLITFSKRVPIHPLHRMPATTGKIALDIERLILQYMNAIASDEDKNNTQLTENIVYQSVTSQEIFNEIICYTMKQSNGSPDEQSLLPAFQLLYYLVVQRHPSDHLLKYVLNYVYSYLGRVDEVGGLAVLILRELLNENAVSPLKVGMYNADRYRHAQEQLRKVELFVMSENVMKNMSVEQILEMEKTTEILWRHGIKPPTEEMYGLNVVFRRYW